MYHVTDVSVGTSPNHPTWPIIRTSIADDKVYDGDFMLGLPVAFFTTTLYNNCLPNQSPYPRDGTPGIGHWRVTIPFDYHKYKIFLMNEYKGGTRGATQIHLLCLDEDNSEAEKLLTAFLTREKQPIDGVKLEKFFPAHRPNEYTQDHMFVNVSFINPVSIAENAQWDTVRKDKFKYGDRINPLYEWGKDKLKHCYDLQQEWERLYKQGKLNQDTVIRTI